MFPCLLFTEKKLTSYQMYNRVKMSMHLTNLVLRELLNITTEVTDVWIMSRSIMFIFQMNYISFIIDMLYSLFFIEMLCMSNKSIFQSHFINYFIEIRYQCLKQISINNNWYSIDISLSCRVWPVNMLTPPRHLTPRLVCPGVLMLIL